MPDDPYKWADCLGDGVYGLRDSCGIWLHANDHQNPTDKIYLEPGVLESLNRFAARCDRQVEKGERPPAAPPISIEIP